MAYITRNANLILLFCIVLSLTFLVGSSVFYQTNLSKLNIQYDQKVQDLDQITKELNTKIRILDQVKKDLKLKAEREESFTSKYTEIRGEKDALESEKKSLTSEKESLESQLTTANEAKKKAEAQTAFEQAQNQELTINLNRAEDRADEYEDLYDSCRDDLAICQAQ
ncbi:MAG: hypothetical protein ACE5FT_05755 [Candidatus Nanoarchaeia archaeon]